MNPTLSARLRGWRQDPYWRVHPPAPWCVALEPATALLHLGCSPAPMEPPSASGQPAVGPSDPPSPASGSASGAAPGSALEAAPVACQADGAHGLGDLPLAQATRSDGGVMGGAEMGGDELGGEVGAGVIVVRLSLPQGDGLERQTAPLGPREPAPGAMTEAGQVAGHPAVAQSVVALSSAEWPAVEPTTLERGANERTATALTAAALASAALATASLAPAAAAVAPITADGPPAVARWRGAPAVAISAAGTSGVVRVVLAPVATERPGSPAEGQPRLAPPRPSRPLIGLLLLTLISLLEGWAALRLLFGQIRAVWWAPAPADRNGRRPLPPAPAPLGLAGVGAKAYP